MIDDLLAGLFGEALFGRLGASRRAQLIARLFFGLLGAGLCAFGAVYMFRRQDAGTGPMRVAMAAVFVSLGAFWLLNVALGRKWRWPLGLIVLTFILLLASRFIFGP